MAEAFKHLPVDHSYISHEWYFLIENCNSSLFLMLTVNKQHKRCINLPIRLSFSGNIYSLRKYYIQKIPVVAPAGEMSVDSYKNVIMSFSKQLILRSDCAAVLLM